MIFDLRFYRQDANGFTINFVELKVDDFGFTIY